MKNIPKPTLHSHLTVNYILFQTNREQTRESEKIMTSDIAQDDAGGWSRATNLSAVNSDSSEYYISFSGNGNLYFGSSRPGGYGHEDIYVSRLVNGAYTQPKNLGATINSRESEHDPCISDDERFIIFKSENRDDGFGEADLYFSKLDDKLSWTPAQNLGSKINTKSYEYCPYFSPDGKYFFYSGQYDIMWMDMQALRSIVKTLD
jgi:Tol biopolymer transport system component